MKILALLLFASLGYAQSPNACVYPYQINDARNTFSFCLTAYGTLASLQYPVGTEHLNPASPLEGFIIDDITQTTPLSMNVVPGYCLGFGENNMAVVTQPSGVGKLPIIFQYTGQVSEIVTSIPGTHTVTFTIKMTKWYKQYNFGNGPVQRFAALNVDGQSNPFVNAANSAWSYNPSGHQVLLSGTYSSAWFDGSAAGSIPLAYGQQVVMSSGYFRSDRGASFEVFNYQAF